MPTKEIEEIPVKDLALYVKENTHYFLPKFKEMSTRKKSASWNWAAFFLDGIYLLYRKVWSWGDSGAGCHPYFVPAEPCYFL